MHIPWNDKLFSKKAKMNKSKSSIAIILMFSAALALTNPLQALAESSDIRDYIPSESTNNIFGEILIALSTAGVMGAILASCLRNNKNNDAPYAVGMSYGGGTIVYVDYINRKLLIMANEDQSSGAEWTECSDKVSAYDGCDKIMYTETIPTRCGSPYETNTIGSGAINTYKIINELESGNAPAAEACANYLGGGYNDWHLPSMWELLQIYWYAIKNGLVGVKGGGNCHGSRCFASENESYWSSTESTKTLHDQDCYSWGVVFGSADIKTEGTKTSYYAVRAVRISGY